MGFVERNLPARSATVDRKVASNDGPQSLDDRLPWQKCPASRGADPFCDPIGKSAARMPFRKPRRSTKRIMCIYGSGGIGKSVLLSRMMEKCVERKLNWVHIEWEDSRRFNYLDVMQEIKNLDVFGDLMILDLMS